MSQASNTQISVAGALKDGVVAVAKGWWLALPVVLVLAAVQTWVGYRLVDWFEGLAAMDAAGRGSTAQVLLAITGFLAFYTLIQLFKAKTASRRSWLPTLFLVPVGLTAAGLSMLGNPGMEPAALSLVYTGWALLFSVFGGAVLAILFIGIGEQVRTTGKVDAGEVIARIRRQWLDVSVPHGARVHAVQLGLQALVVPGVYFAAQLAFTDQIAVLHPEERALQRSARLTDGIRSRILQLLFLGFLVTTGVAFGVGYALDGPEALVQALIVPFTISETTTYVWDVTRGMVWGVVDIALLSMYHARLARVRELAERRKKQAETKAEPVAEEASAP